MRMENDKSLIRIQSRNLTRRELRKLCLQPFIREHSTFLVFTGSSVEIPVAPGGQADLFYAVNPEHFDTDLMFYNTRMCALSIDKEIPESFVGEVLRIYTHDVHPGYARLFRDKNDDDIGQISNLKLINVLEDLSCSYFVDHGPAHQTSMLERIRYSGRRKDFNYREFDSYLLKYLKHDYLDTVFSVHCPYWPNEAAEWVNRERIHGLPCKCLIKRVVKYGCHLVEVSPKTSDESDRYLYWRFSFSVAEYFIIQNWNTFQRIVYRTLRCLYKMILSKQGTSKLCTYFFKTLMLWECESRDPDTWKPNSLRNIVVDLLYKMIYCLESRQCSNYFISNNNMMDHLIPEDITIDLHSLRTYVAHDYLLVIDNVLKWSEYNEQFTQQAYHQIECPNWLKISFSLLQHNQNSSIHRNTFRNNKIAQETERAVTKELYNIYLSLYFQREAAACAQSEKKERYSFAAKHQLETATLLCESSDRCFVEFLPNSTEMTQVRWLFSYFLRKDSFSINRNTAEFKSNLHPKFCARRERGESIHASNVNHIQKCLLYSRDSRTQALILNLVTYKPPLTLYSVFHESETKTIYDERIIPVLPGFPTVNVSWFIAKALLANLIYVTEKRYSLVIEICDEIIDTYHSTFAHVWFADLCLPFFISTQWAAVYDTDIQQVLGFYSLCSYIMNMKGCHEINLNVCAVHLSVYLKTRCAMDLKRVWDINRYLSRWTDHFKKCTYDRNSTNARIVLLTILRSHGVNLAGIPVLFNMFGRSLTMEELL